MFGDQRYSNFLVILLKLSRAHLLRSSHSNTDLIRDRRFFQLMIVRRWDRNSPLFWFVNKILILVEKDVSYENMLLLYVLFFLLEWTKLTLLIVFFFIAALDYWILFGKFLIDYLDCFLYHQEWIKSVSKVFLIWVGSFGRVNLSVWFHRIFSIYKLIN